MRTLLVLRGAPGCGKSTWVRENGLAPYTLCPDDIRVLCSSRELKADGSFAIARNHQTEQETWKVIFELLEYRMSRGELTVLDATGSKTKDIQQYKDLADMYRYRTYVVDFTDVPLEKCLEQNKMRPQDKWVPEEGIRNIYARFATQPVPGRVEVIKPNELDKIMEKPLDLSSYKKIVFIGDIHGCYDTLMQYPDFKEGLKDDTEYIFLGDYIDRGNQNAEVMKYLYSIMDKPNVCFLEGNHERWIRDYGNSVEAKSKEFAEKTQGQLIMGGFDQKMARMFYRKVRQMSHFMYNGVEVLACHGGIPGIFANPTFIPTHAFINGVGEYNDYQEIADTWNEKMGPNQYLIHGHINTQNDPCQIADRVFNLEGEVEFGGKLRIVELTTELVRDPDIQCLADFCNEETLQEFRDGKITAPLPPLKKIVNWNVVELANCQPITEDTDTTVLKVDTVHDAINYLRNNKFVTEKKLGGDISSFNFTREAFYSANWNRQTILARGLFLDTKNEKVMARSYEKFFRLGETRETELIALKGRLQFPVSAYVKENGFLAVVSYDYKNDDLFIASKSTNKGDYVEYIKAQLEPYRDNILHFLREYYRSPSIPLSLVFECCDPEHDPHIIKYNEPKLVLLDAIHNDLTFKAVDYEKLKIYAQVIGCPVKRLAYTLKTWEEFRDLYMAAQDEEYKLDGEYIEGYVFVDSKGFMTKLKTGYYNFWKFLRGVADATLRAGYYGRTGALQTVGANKFYGWCRKLFNTDRIKETKSYPYKTDIISLREKYIAENANG